MAEGLEVLGSAAANLAVISLSVSFLVAAVVAWGEVVQVVGLVVHAPVRHSQT